MAKISHKQVDDLAYLDEIGGSKSDYKKVKFDDVINTLTQLAGVYIENIINELDKVDAYSSGHLSDNIKPTELEVNGSKYTIGIEAPMYISYVDEGVDGWAVSRGSRFKFKTRGVNPDGDLVANISRWLKREQKTNRSLKKAVSTRERRAKKITDTSKRAAMTAAFMIKRQGIKKKHFFTKATKKFTLIMKQELGTALKIDMINNLTK